MNWDFYNSKDVLTRKKHFCHLCNIEIKPKTKCFYESGKFDGDMVSRWSHFECAEKWKDMNIQEHNDEWIEFYLMDEVYPYTEFNDWKKMIKNNYRLNEGE